MSLLFETLSYAADVIVRIKSITKVRIATGTPRNGKLAYADTARSLAQIQTARVLSLLSGQCQQNARQAILGIFAQLVIRMCTYVF